MAAGSQQALEEVKQLLSASPWFDSLEADPAEATLIIFVQPLERTPYWHSPGHSPGAAILALVIPLPWKLKAGYALTVGVPGSAGRVQIDTRREATAVAWSLAPLLNIFGRNLSFGFQPERELAQVHAQLLPLVEQRP